MSNQAQNPLTIVGDSPKPEQDLLHFMRYVEPLVELITDTNTETPFTIGIFGKWGSGKTTLMRMTEEQLPTDSYPAIWFNPWLYQKEENLLVPLLQTIHDSLKESPIQRIRASAERIATVVAQVSISLLLKTVTMNKVSLEGIENRIDTYNKQRAQAVSTIRTLREELQKVVDEVTNNGKDGRLIIYIDDLDRCVSTKIVGLLEAIKLFLDLKHTVIFLAIDREVVQQGIQVFYKDFKWSKEESISLTSDYIEKMIQLPLYLHPLGPEQVGGYLGRLGLAPNLMAHYDLFRYCLQPNPRKIKRVLNLYALQEAIVTRMERQNSPQRPINRSLLAKLIIIQQQWYDLYRDVTTHHDLLALLERVYKDQLDIKRSEMWVFLRPRQEELHKLCAHYYQSSYQLASLFDYGESFQDVKLDKYLFMLG